MCGKPIIGLLALPRSRLAAARADGNRFSPEGPARDSPPTIGARASKSVVVLLLAPLVPGIRSTPVVCRIDTAPTVLAENEQRKLAVNRAKWLLSNTPRSMRPTTRCQARKKRDEGVPRSIYAIGEVCLCEPVEGTSKVL